MRNPRKELLREELAVLREELMLPRQSTNLRALNVAICRLRRKVRQAGGRLPLHTVHGVGYVFLGNLQEVADLLIAAAGFPPPDVASRRENQ